MPGLPDWHLRCGLSCYVCTMKESTPLEKLLNAERELLEFIEDLKEQYRLDVESYDEDVTFIRNLITELKEGRNDNAWEDYVKDR